jgi:hypothetical protein
MTTKSDAKGVRPPGAPAPGGFYILGFSYNNPIKTMAL